MVRISVFAAALAIICATENVLGAQPKETANTAKPCTQEEFMANCHKQAAVHYCEWWWDKQRRIGGNCMR